MVAKSLEKHFVYDIYYLTRTGWSFGSRENRCDGSLLIFSGAGPVKRLLVAIVRILRSPLDRTRRPSIIINLIFPREGSGEVRIISGHRYMFKRKKKGHQYMLKEIGLWVCAAYRLYVDIESNLKNVSKWDLRYSFMTAPCQSINRYNNALLHI